MVVTDTFFPASVERVGLMVQDTPMQDDGQQVADEIEVEVELVEVLDTAQDMETVAEAATEVEVEEIDEAVATDDFHVCVDGHQFESDPGPGPGPSLGPFCSDILSWLRYCTLVK